MEKSKTTIAMAILEFQATSRASQTNEDNPFFKSRYVTLDKLWEDIREDLQKLGLAVIQNPLSENGLYGIESIIIHVLSGESINCKLLLPAVKQDPQAVGSCITYARRYALASQLGLTVMTDDDGNLASGHENKQPPNKQQTLPPKEKESESKKDYKIVCDKCHAEITGKVATYSMEKYKKPLCYDCQKKETK